VVLLNARVLATHAASTHAFSKQPRPAVRLVEGLGVDGDAHAGVNVQHRSRVARDPHQPNLRQVHLLHAELLDELTGRGLAVAPGDLGENLTTRGAALLDLPTGTLLHLGDEAVVRLTGLRNPCAQIDRFRPGLMAAVLDRDAQGRLIRKAGVMGVVLRGGWVRAGDAVRVEIAPGLNEPLAPV
jgi:MOSC domain-containing protein YiiM